VDLGLSGIPAAVAGASRGLGYAIALELAMEGAEVSICSRDEEAVESAASVIQGSTGADVHPYAADVSTEEGARRFVEEAADKMNGLQILITNSGGPPQGPTDAFDDPAWLEAVENNFLSAVRLTRAARPFLEKREWGRIVCITSSTVKQPEPHLALSNATRAATTNFAKTLSGELAGSAITVNCVMPGQILTDRLRSLSGAGADAGTDDPVFQSMGERIPVGRIGKPEELAAVVVFLCSERASFLNGVNLAVDGGFLRGV
jgi:3-oxoacyl-[acyl-carrier protein] reductase